MLKNFKKMLKNVKKMLKNVKNNHLLYINWRMILLKV